MTRKTITIHTKLILNLFIVFFACSIDAQDLENGKDISSKINEHIDSLYHEDVIGVSTDGLIRGKEAMRMYLIDFQKSQGTIVESKTHYSAPVYEVLNYEIGSFKTALGKQFSHITIWSNENGSMQSIAEVIHEQSTKEKDAPAELAEARKKWVVLCNKKDAKKLVTELYTEDAIYYNRGRVLRGHDQLSQEYSYMNSPSYSLNLEPKHIEMVTENLIYEIGMCSGSYNLPYILIWKKQSDGNWKIYLDSNY